MGDFLCIGTLPSIEEIKTNINTKYDDLFSYSDEESIVQLLCVHSVTKFCSAVKKYAT
jgi:hypothetical protein